MCVGRGGGGGGGGGGICAYLKPADFTHFRVHDWGKRKCHVSKNYNCIIYILYPQIFSKKGQAIVHILFMKAVDSCGGMVGQQF